MPEQLVLAVDATVETLTIQNPQFRLRHVEPASVLGRRMEFQTVQESPSFFGRKRLVQARPVVSIQIVFHKDNHLGVGIVDVAKFLDAHGPIPASSACGHPDMCHPRKGAHIMNKLQVPLRTYS